MNDFVFQPDALKDLDEIWEYIASESIDAADRVRDEIYDAIKSLVPFPYVGHQRPDLTTRPLRFAKQYASMWSGMRRTRSRWP
jgi:antitoxin ParD1/3/4/toxin ParE1/3/4